ncbi:MAG: cytochrome b/b6 domain-containing protein [Deltaproteobacteria bacterium]|jgi:thiosulfate reductase cytochrome b subunit|nr:cytochrome b/b6 domain-containing protein [Deltaproteobacteria bacterium]MCW8892940.1 cytochrome b/b6 domain-containing protein [Deltaproteobacteria bacterium]MCW9049145.1 cytochrome b/b6 domain-containing protein [Deltaproteobacteria bacterium]
MAEKKKIYLQPTPVRIWHWINAFGIITLTVSGAQIRFPEYITFLGSYKSAIYLHNTAGFVVAISFSLWFFYYMFVSRTMANLYVPKAADLKTGLVRQAKFYFLTYFLGWENPHHPTPENKFNPMQKSVYLGVMFVMMPLVSLSGIFLTNVDPLRELIVMVGGLKLLAGLHFLLACCLIAFIPTHVYLATLGHTPMEHIKTMWSGWEDEETEEAGTQENKDELASRRAA